MQIDLLSGYEGRSRSIDTRRMVNLYAEINTQGSKSIVSLIATPGFYLLASVAGAIRGADQMANLTYFVSAGTLYELNSAGSTTALGVLNTTSGRVSIANNGTQLMMVDGTNGYIYDTTYSSFYQIKQYSTGTADGTTANKLVDSGATFQTDGVPVGTIVYNTTDLTTATVTAVDSEGQLSVSSDIFASGEDYEVGTDAFPDGAAFVDFLDGYFKVENADTNQWNISGAYDGSAWDALDFASAEGNPDYILRTFTYNKEAWLFGSKSTEVWYNSGAADFPFSYRTYMDYGCAAPNSVAKGDNSVIWLSQSERGEKMVVRAQGYQPVRISNHAVEYAIDTYSVISDAWAFSYVEEGHSFYVLTFPTAGKTWVHDSSIPDPRLAWHERSSKVDGTDTRWIPNAYFYAWGKHYVGDYNSGNIYQMDHSAYDENGVAIQRDYYTNHITSDEERIFINSVELIAERGVGLQSGQGSNPQVMMRHSKDGGYTYGVEKWRGVGKVGKYAYRAKWNRMGMARDHVFHFRMTDPVKWVINGITAK